MPAPSLHDMATRSCVRNLHMIYDLGSEISYELVRPILKKLDDPHQLREIEINSPHLADHDAELWQAFLHRDIQNWHEIAVEPTNPRSWWKVYRKMAREEQHRRDASEEMLIVAMNQAKYNGEVKKAKFVSEVIPQPAVQMLRCSGQINPKHKLWRQAAASMPVSAQRRQGMNIMKDVRRQGAKVMKPTWGPQKTKEEREAHSRSQILAPPRRSLQPGRPKWNEFDPESLRDVRYATKERAWKRELDPDAVKLGATANRRLDKADNEREARLRALAETNLAYASFVATPAPTIVSPRPPPPPPPAPQAKPSIFPVLPRQRSSTGWNPNGRPAIDSLVVSNQTDDQPAASNQTDGNAISLKRPREPVSIFMPTKKR